MSLTFEVLRGSKEGKIVTDKTSRSLEYNEVYVEITHSGVCGTDEHYLHSGQVLGHEGVGIVRHVGPGVKTVKAGDRVGLGYLRKVCGRCDGCLTGWDQYCRNKNQYGFDDFDLGTFSQGVTWDADCLFKIPEGYNSAYAAPLMCAGATVWTVLQEYGIRPADRVGICGMGGLGHLAIKLASAMGCHVVVLSSSSRKKQEALEMGAIEFHVFRPEIYITQEEMKPLDHLLLCGSARNDYDSLLPLMEPRGTIYPLTADMEPSSINLARVTHQGIRLQGSIVASRHGTRQLLEFCAEKDIRPSIMTFPLNRDGAEEALKSLREKKIRYRAVLVR